MRVLGRSVLIFEAIIMGLFIPVAYFTGTGVSGPATIVVGSGILVACILAAGLLRTTTGVIVGWLVQIAIILTGIFVPVMFIVGFLFAVLWWAALYFGRRADHIHDQIQKQSAS